MTTHPPELMAHQREGVEWLKENKRGLLAWSPGLGKTLTTLAFIHEASDALPALIVAPRGLLNVWKDEIEKWYSTLDYCVLTGNMAKRRKMIDERHAVYIVGYETMRMTGSALSSLDWGTVVLDESGKVRSPLAKVSKCIHNFKARYRIALDGTPVSNSIADLWNICTWLDKTCLYGSWWKFRSYHAIMNQFIPGKIDGWRGAPDIVEKTKHLIQWKGKGTLTNLPPITEQDVPVSLTDEEKQELRRLRNEMEVIVSDGRIPITNALTLLLRMRQYLDGDNNYGSSKLELLEELLSTISGKCIIFCAFKPTVAKIKELYGESCHVITGEETPLQKNLALELFKSGHGRRILVGTSALARGFNIQEAGYIIHFDLPWSYAQYDQQIGRAWRNGQTKNVHVYNMVAEAPVEKKIRKILADKQSLAENLSRKEIAELLDISL